MFQASRPKVKLTKATHDKLLRSAKLSKPPSGAGQRRTPMKEFDFVVDDAGAGTAQKGLHETAWNVAAVRDVSEDNDNNGKCCEIQNNKILFTFGRY